MLSCSINKPIKTNLEGTKVIEIKFNRDHRQTPNFPSNTPFFFSHTSFVLPFLTAINRGQDYCKSSNNIALIPANGTFALSNILSQAARCLRSIMPTGRHLVIHPLPDNLCNMIISDSHWLLENVLCLVSNAIKYSDSGDVDLRVHISTDMTAVGTNSSQTDLVVDIDPVVEYPHHSTKSTVSSHSRVVVSDSMLVVTIEDHGVGVSMEMRETLFQPFRQAQRMAGGTGDTVSSPTSNPIDPSTHISNL